MRSRVRDAAAAWPPDRPEPAPSVSRHDHVGSMVFRPCTCGCSVCGQAWVLRRLPGGGRRWEPTPVPFAQIEDECWEDPL